MAEPAVVALPRGRHGLSRQEVTEAQRLRLVVGMAEALADGGYVATPVAAVLTRAGVSRQTFYELYDGKLACFLDALDFVGEVLVGELAASLEGEGTPVDRAARAVERYLATLAANPAYARLFLVEVHAAGPEAIERRAALQDRIVEALSQLFGDPAGAGEFACRVFVAAVSSLVTAPLAAGDGAALEALRDPLISHLRMLATDGPLAAPPAR